MLKTEKILENINSNAPKRLVSLWRKLDSDRKVARMCGVNHFYVSQLLWRGIEPDDKTENQQEIRARLFLPRKKIKPRVPKPEGWTGQKRVVKKIRKLHSETTRTFKRGMSIADK